MSEKRNIAVIVGSLRKESLCRKSALALADLAPSSLSLSIAEIGQLSMYNQDLDEAPPSEWISFREAIRAADGVIFITPEYNRSVPGCLKNAIDIGSRPYGKSAWDGKPGAVMSVTPGSQGAFGANHHLRQSLVFLNVLTMQQPEAYFSNASTFFGSDGKLANDETKKYFTRFIESYGKWVDRLQQR